MFAVTALILRQNNTGGSHPAKFTHFMLMGDLLALRSLALPEERKRDIQLKIRLFFS